MNREELKKELDAGRVKNLYIFCSDDYYLKNLYLNRIKKVFSDSTSIDKIELYTEDDLHILNQHINETPLFDNLKKRLIYARLHFPIKEINIKMSKNSVAVVDVMDCKKIKNNSVVELDEPKPTKQDIASFISGKLKKGGKHFDDGVVSYITSLFDKSSITALNLFLDKLLLYSYNKDAVYKKDVDECIVHRDSKNLFAILGYLKNGDKKIISYVDEALSFDNPQRFLSSLSTVAVNILITSMFRPDEASKFMVNPNMYNSYYNAYRSIGKRKLNELIVLLHDLDVIFKTSAISSFKELLKIRLFNWLHKK